VNLDVGTGDRRRRRDPERRRGNVTGNDKIAAVQRLPAGDFNCIA
jgi:hypothetical protein